MAELMDEHGGADIGAVVDNHLAGHLGRIADDAVAAQRDIVSDVDALHEQIVRADDGPALGRRAAIDGDILADAVAVADDGRRLFAAELEVLRDGADHRSGEDRVAVAYSGAAQDGDAVHQNIVVADLHVFIDVAECTYFTILADFRFGVYVCQRAYVAHVGCCMGDVIM